MFIRTNSNIYEINKCDDIIVEDKKVTGYYHCIHEEGDTKHED